MLQMVNTLPIRHKKHLLSLVSAIISAREMQHGYNEEGKENPRKLNFKAVMNTKVEKRTPIEFELEDIHYQNNTAIYMESRYNRLCSPNRGFYE